MPFETSLGEFQADEFQFVEFTRTLFVTNPKMTEMTFSFAVSQFPAGDFFLLFFRSFLAGFRQKIYKPILVKHRKVCTGHKMDYRFIILGFQN